MSQEAFKSPVHELMYGRDFIEDTLVFKSRKLKICDLCGQLIPKGTASKGAKLFNDSYIRVHFCKVCEEKYKRELSLMYQGKLNDY